MNVKFVCRKTKASKDGLIPIEMSICIKCKRKYIVTGRKVKPKAFCAKTQKVKGDSETNEFLAALKSRVYSIETELLRNGEDITVDSILSVFKDGDTKKSITILSLFELHYDKIRKKVSKKLLAPTTLSKYIVTKDYLIKYLKSEKKVNDILIKNITPNFIEGFFLFLLKSMANNTAVHKMKQLKAILKMAVEEGYIDVSPFKLELKNEKVDVEPLTVEEITRIKNKQIDMDRLAKNAERAYSYHVNLVYQRALIDALIKGGYIDCFKKIRAGCSEANSILDIYGNSLSNKQFRINCELDCI